MGKIPREAINYMNLHADKNIIEAIPGEISDISERLSIPAGQYIIRANEPINFFYILINGSAKLIHDDVNESPLIIDIYHSGDFFGEMEMVGLVTKDRSILAMTQCEVLRFSREQFFKLWNESSSFSQWLLYVHCERLLRAGEDKINSDRTMLRGRVFRIIQANLNDKGYFLYTKQILAEMVGISMRSLNRTLKELETDRFIILSSGTIRLYIET